LRTAQENHWRTGEATALFLLGRTLGKEEPPQTEKAEKSILEGIKVFEELKIKTHYAPGYYYLGELYAEAGQKDKASETLKKAESLFREMEMVYWLAKTQKILRSLED